MSKIINEITSRAVPFPEIDLDTDKIAPTDEALYVLSWEEAGDVFCILERQKNSNHVLDRVEYKGARILFAGKNFGCGSSREHATQATLARYDAVVAPSFAPIFGDNAYAIGLPVLKVEDSSQMDSLVKIAESDPTAKFRISLESLTISHGEMNIPLILDASKRDGFLKGTWDERQRLVAGLDKTQRVLSRLPYFTGKY